MSTAGARNSDLVEQGQQLRVVTGLVWSEDDPHRQPASVHGEVDLAAWSPSGASEGFTIDRERFGGGSAAPFFFVLRQRVDVPGPRWSRR